MDKNIAAIQNIKTVIIEHIIEHYESSVWWETYVSIHDKHNSFHEAPVELAFPHIVVACDL